jgi:hypothetical protein
VSPDEKPRFHELLSALFGAHGKPLSEGMISGYWKGLNKMSLQQFEACCDKAIERLSFAERGQSKTPTVAELWDIKRGFLGRPPVTIEHEDVWLGDDWDAAANQLLMHYISKSDASRYAPDSYYDGRKLVTGPETKRLTEILVKWKNAWARDQREDQAMGRKLDGRKLWVECMANAEGEINRYQVAA